MLDQCEFHGYSKLGCPGCRKSAAETTKQIVASGEYVYIACAWRGDGRYDASQAQGCKFYKSEKLAQKWCDKLNADGLAIGANPNGYVVRLVANVSKEVAC